MNYVLFKVGSVIYKYDGVAFEATSLIEPLSQLDYETHGVTSLLDISKTDLLFLGNEVEVLTWTNAPEEIFYAELETTESFKPLDLIQEGGEFEVLTWTDAEETPKLELTVPEHRPIRLLEEPVSLVTWTDSEDVPEVSMNVLAESFIHYQLSKDNIEWVGWNGENWSEEYKMTKEEVEALTPVEFKALFGNSIYQKDLYYKVFMESHNPSNSTVIRKITTTFKPNNPPVILEPIIMPDEIHNSYVQVQGQLRDFEGDSIEYRVMIKKSGESEFYVVNDWLSVPNNHNFNRAYNYPYFLPGDNTVRVEVRDQRGESSYWESHVVLLNEDPYLTIIYTDFNVSGVIGDDDGDDVAWRVKINGQVMFDYTSFAPSPREFWYSWDSDDLNFGVMNDVTVETIDTHGGYASETFQVLGTYKGLMFVDSNGNYYTTDKGDILKMLDIGTIVGGQISEPSKVVLQNMNGFHVEDVEIEPINSQVNDHVTVEVSTSDNPFNPVPIIKVAELMAHAEEKPFFVRINSGKYARGGGEFEIVSRAEPVI